MLKRYEPKPIPAEIVTEMMSNVRFTKNQKKDLQIAENIAGNEYTSMKDLMETIEGNITNPKLKACFKEECRSYPQNAFYAKYFETNP